MRISKFGQQQAKGTSANDYDDIHVLYVQAIMILCYSLVFLNYLIPIKQGMTYRIILIDKMISYSNITCINSRYYFFPSLKRAQSQDVKNCNFQYYGESRWHVKFIRFQKSNTGFHPFKYQHLKIFIFFMLKDKRNIILINQFGSLYDDIKSHFK